VFPSANLSQDTTLLHHFIKPLEQALKALIATSHYIGHIHQPPSYNLTATLGYYKFFSPLF